MQSMECIALQKALHKTSPALFQPTSHLSVLAEKEAASS
jgi:hypothetical protein